MKEVNVGIIGIGTVGTGVLKILKDKKDKIASETGIRINVEQACDIDPAQKEKVISAGVRSFTTSAEDVIMNPRVEIVVELIGNLEPAFTFIKKALENEKSVITANKEVLSQKGEELFEVAEEKKVDLFFEASVGGGIPIIRPLKEMLIGNSFSLVMGIVNGTTNYILTRMEEEKLKFDEALKIAKEKGYAEPDPRADIEGDDAASKIAILSSIAFNSRVVKSQVYKEGISGVSPQDIEYAKEFGCCIRLLAYSKKADGRIFTFVRPALIRLDHPLASVKGVYNAIFVEGDSCGQLMFYGEGAGSLAAGSSVVGDIVQAARNIVQNSRGSIGCTCIENYPVASVDELESKYYILLSALDKPGVLAKIAGCFGEAQVSIASVIQKESFGDKADIVFMTHKTFEKNLRQAINLIKKCDVVDIVKSIFMVVEE